MQLQEFGKVREVSERLRAALVSDCFAVLVGHAKIFRPVLVVPNPNPIPVLNIGHGTLLPIRLPTNGSQHLATLLVFFIDFLTGLVPPRQQQGDEHSGK